MGRKRKQFTQIQQVLEKKFPNKLDITGELDEPGTFEVILPETGIVLHSKKNGAGYVDTEEKIKAICDGIRKQLRIKAPKTKVVTKKLMKRQDLGHASQKLEAKPERKPEAKPERKLATIPELKAEMKEPSLTDLTPSPETEKETEGFPLTKPANDLGTTTTRRT